MRSALIAADPRSGRSVEEADDSGYDSGIGGESQLPTLGSVFASLNKSVGIGDKTTSTPEPLKADSSQYAWMEGNKYKFVAPYCPADAGSSKRPRKASEKPVVSGSVLDNPNRSSCIGYPKPGFQPRMQRKLVSRNRDAVALYAQNLVAAQMIAEAESGWPLTHGIYSLMGLSMLQLLRASAWYQGNVPGYAVYGMHCLTAVCDMASIIFTLPLFGLGIQGQCVQLGYLGPMMTLVFVMSLVDSGALCAFMWLATPRPVAAGSRSILDVAEATVGIWEWLLVGSVSLQISLMVSSWRIYRGLRHAGIYPPGSSSLVDGEVREVSVLEVMCEAEDAEMIANCDCRPDDCAPDGAISRRPFGAADLIHSEDGPSGAPTRIVVEDGMVRPGRLNSLAVSPRQNCAQRSHARSAYLGQLGSSEEFQDVMSLASAVTGGSRSSTDVGGCKLTNGHWAECASAADGGGRHQRCPSHDFASPRRRMTSIQAAEQLWSSPGPLPIVPVAPLAASSPEEDCPTGRLKDMTPQRIATAECPEVGPLVPPLPMFRCEPEMEVEKPVAAPDLMASKTPKRSLDGGSCAVVATRAAVAAAQRAAAAAAKAAGSAQGPQGPKSLSVAPGGGIISNGSKVAGPGPVGDDDDCSEEDLESQSA